MVGGFNHNFSYKGQTYHVQTEDSGTPRARITTLLYRAGTIIARETTDYSSMDAEADLDARVEQLMKEQHRAMLKNLKDGKFDARIAQFDASSSGGAGPEETVKSEKEDNVTPAAQTVAQTPAASKTQPVLATLDARVKAYLDAGR